jgi:putative hemolysin
MNEASILLIFTSILLTLLLSAFFSGMEIAFVSSNKLKIELDKKLGILPARVYSFFLKHQSKFISTLLLGNNVALVIYGIFMAQVLESPIASAFSFIPSVGAINALVLLIQTIISTLIILVFAEFLPKIIFRINPNRKLELFILPVVVLCFPLFILVWLVFVIVSFVLNLFNVSFEESKYAFGRVDLDH